jgi:hypothetical protein
MATERYDIVIFGASGFTGQFVVEEVAKVAPAQGLTWAVSGRSMGKIQQVLNKASKRTGYKLSTLISHLFFFLFLFKEDRSLIFFFPFLLESTVVNAKDGEHEFP